MVPRAFVVLKHQGLDRRAVAADRASLIRTKIGGYKVPDRIEFVEALSRTPLMKIDRRALREVCCAQTLPERLIPGS